MNVPARYRARAGYFAFTIRSTCCGEPIVRVEHAGYYAAMNQVRPVPTARAIEAATEIDPGDPIPVFERVLTATQDKCGRCGQYCGRNHRLFAYERPATIRLKR